VVGQLLARGWLLDHDAKGQVTGKREDLAGGAGGAWSGVLLRTEVDSSGLNRTLTGVLVTVEDSTPGLGKRNEAAQLA
jgi:hypothetical protein